MLCCLLVLQLLVREVSASPSKFTHERAMCSFRKSRGVCVGLLALTCHPQSSSQSGDSMRICSEEVDHNREERIPFTLVMPYRKQRETNASKVNVIKKERKKRKLKNKIKKKAAAFSARDIELSKMVEYRAFFFLCNYQPFNKHKKIHFSFCFKHSWNFCNSSAVICFCFSGNAGQEFLRPHIGTGLLFLGLVLRMG